MALASTVPSNITNTVALCPGYFGGTNAQRRDLAGRRRRLARPRRGRVGGLVGSILLVISPEKLFRRLVPFLILAPARCSPSRSRSRHLRVPSEATRTGCRRRGDRRRAAERIYGGYFGAGLGIVTLATLGVLLPDESVRVNALKSAITLVTNVVAAPFFAFSGDVVWRLVLVMARAALRRREPRRTGRRSAEPNTLRAIVAVIGVIVAVKFWL